MALLLAQFAPNQLSRGMQRNLCRSGNNESKKTEADGMTQLQHWGKVQKGSVWQRRAPNKKRRGEGKDSNTRCV